MKERGEGEEKRILFLVDEEWDNEAQSQLPLPVRSKFDVDREAEIYAP